MSQIRWFTQADDPREPPDLLVRFQDDRIHGELLAGGVFGFFSLARRKGYWERNDNAIDVTGFGGVSGAREISEQEARRIEAEWLAPGADAAP